jgi:hypothetical protein
MKRRSTPHSSLLDPNVRETHPTCHHGRFPMNLHVHILDAVSIDD